MAWISLKEAEEGQDVGVLRHRVDHLRQCRIIDLSFEPFEKSSLVSIIFFEAY